MPEISLDDATVSTGYDAAAIHDDESGEIAAISDKASPIAADLLLIEDSADSNAKKKVQAGNLPGGGSGDTHPMVQTTNLVKGLADATKLARIDTDANVPTGTAIVVKWPAVTLSLADVLIAAAVIADHAVVRGAGGGRGLQDSPVTIDDSGHFNGPANWMFQANSVDALKLVGTEDEYLIVWSGTQAVILYPESATEADIDLKLGIKGSGSVFARVGGAYRPVVTTTGAQTLTDKKHTLPQINDASADHQYIFAVGELVANRIITLPLLTGNDEFVFKDHTQTLTNKSINATQLTGTIAGARLAAKHKTITKVLQIPAPEDEEEYVFDFGPYASTLVEVNHYCTAGSVNFNIEFRDKTTPSTTSATKAWSSDKTINTSSSTETSFDTAGISANKVLCVTFDNPASVGAVYISVERTIND